MKLLGNIIWLLVSGFEGFCSWMIVGLVWCITIIGIPVGQQCFKLAFLSLWPFGKHIERQPSPASFLLNVFWFFFGGIWLALGHLGSAILLCITIIGIPFAKQSLKLASLSLHPFGTTIVED